MAFKKEEIQFEDGIPFAMYETNAKQVMIHSHDCLEINLILKGNGYYLIENRTYHIHENDLFIINNAEHHMAIHDGNLTMLVVVFAPEFVLNGPAEYEFLNSFFQRGMSFSNMVAEDCPFYDRLRSHLEQMAAEYTGREAGWELMVKSNLLMFLGYLNRYCLSSRDTRPDSMQLQGYSRIRSVIEYIHGHFDRELTLEELAEQAAMGKSYFSSYFTCTMKMRVFDYIEQVRVNHAAVLLKTTSDSILEIALQSGFHSSAYFNRVFKKIWKMTPSAYRKSKDRTNLQK